MRGRTAASIVLAASLILGTTGCTLFAIQGTLRHYSPSDGVDANVGQVKLRDIIALSADGKDVAIIMTVINAGDSTANVNVQFDDGTGGKPTQTVAVPAHSSVTVGDTGDNQLVFRGVNTTVGGLLPLYFQYADDPGKQLLIPVLDGTLPAYTNLLPSPEPTVTQTPTPVPTPSPSPSH